MSEHFFIIFKNYEIGKSMKNLKPKNLKQVDSEPKNIKKSDQINVSILIC